MGTINEPEFALYIFVESVTVPETADSFPDQVTCSTFTSMEGPKEAGNPLMAT